MKNILLLLTGSLLFSSHAFAYKASKTKNYRSYEDSKYRDDSSRYSDDRSYDERRAYERPSNDYRKDYRDSKSSSYKSSSKNRNSYSPRTRRNFEKYKSYSPSKRRDLQKNWSSFKQNSKWNSLSNERKQEIRRKILQKRKRK